MNGTNTQNDPENGRWCDICALNGHKVKLQYFQINYEDAILICPAKEVSFDCRLLTAKYDKLVSCFYGTLVEIHK